MTKNKNLLGVVYSTNPDFGYEAEPDSNATTLQPAKQNLKLLLEKRNGSKLVTVVKGFVGTEDDLEKLAKQLKNHCGSGGTAKDGEAVIQGDHSAKIFNWLTNLGYRTKK
ncbi:MAG: translation initiation factor [Flavobacteriaceae bacterium]|nr:translation initiation factor [Flavobacteriaceae bacterium]